MLEKLKLLIVEDEEAILCGLIDLFVFHGYEVDFSRDGEEGLEKALTGRYDLIILDVMLPKVDGFSICNTVRKASREQLIIMLTAKTSEDDIINGLSLGADDYIAKPFSVRELILRVEAVIRRSKQQLKRAAMILIAKSWEIDRLNLTGRQINQERGVVVEFTSREVEILDYLKANSYRPVSREELLEEVWGYKRGSQIETRTVDIHMAKLRRKIEVNPKEPMIITTVRGSGYRLQEGEDECNG